MLKIEFIARPLSILFTYCWSTGQFKFLLHALPAGDAIPSKKPASCPFDSPDDPAPSSLCFISYTLSLRNLNHTYFLSLCSHPPSTASILTDKITSLSAELGHITNGSKCPPPGHYSISPSFRFGLNGPPCNWTTQLRSRRSRSLHLQDRVLPSESFRHERFCCLSEKLRFHQRHP